MTARGREIFHAMLVTAIVVLVLLNGSRHFVRLDLTDGKQFTLNDASVATVRELPNPVTITYYLSGRVPSVVPEVNLVRGILEEYAAHGRGHVRLVVRNADDPELASEAESYGVTPQVMETVDGGEQRQAVVYSGIVIRYLDRQMSLPLVYDAATIEYDVTNALRTLVANRRRSLGVLVGDRSRSLHTDYYVLATRLAGSFAVREVEPGQPVPADLDVLFVLGNRHLSRDDVAHIDRFLLRGRGVLFAAEGVYVDILRNMDAWPLADSPLLEALEHYGVRVHHSLVLDHSARNFRVPREDGGWSVVGRYPQWVSIAAGGEQRDGFLASHFAGLDVLWASPVSLADSSRVNATPLCVTTDGAWLMEEPFVTDPYEVAEMHPPSRQSGSRHVVGYAMDGRVTSFVNPGLQSADTRFIVVGDADFASGLMRYSDSPHNLVFLESCADWLAMDDAMLEIRTRTPLSPFLDRPPTPEARRAAARFATIVNVMLVPAAVGAYGLLRVRRRRRRANEPARGAR
jgi:ABC-type uncharacterized transport system involved in gliding motility auxiliary subunit